MYQNPQPEKTSFNMGQMVQSIKPAIQSVIKSVGDAANSLQKGVSEVLPKAPSLSASFPALQNESSQNGDFLSMNSIVTKIAFLLFIVILFLLLIKLTMSIMVYAYQEKNNPVLVDGVIAGSTAVTITRDPNSGNSVHLPRSNNQYYGAEFTWSFWLNVNSVTDKFSHVFHVGNQKPLSNGIMSIHNAPGVYLMKHKSYRDQKGHALAMRVIMDTEPFHNFNVDNSGSSISGGITVSAAINTDNTITHSKFIDITELPFNNWFNVMVRLENSVLDIYVNGTIAGRINFETVPKQNFYDVQICQNSGFSGYLSNLKYYSRALNIFDINAIVLGGPNLATPVIKGANSNPALPGGKLNSYDYLSNLWYYR